MCFIEKSSDFGFVVNILVDVFFLTDIAITFNTALEGRHGIYNTNRIQIAKTYLRGWFALDFITSIPFEILEKIDEEGDHVYGTSNNR